MSSVTTRRPELTARVLLLIEREVGPARCWRLLDEAWFDLGDDRRISVRPDDAGRFRLEAWRGSSHRATVWAAAGDWLRLAEAITEILGGRVARLNTIGVKSDVRQRA